MNLKLSVLIVIAAAVCGCARTEDVNRRKAGEPWYYYGYLLNFYHDENRGSPVALVWREQVQVQTVDRAAFQKTVKTLISQGYKKLGYLALRSAYPIYPEDVTGLAADKGAQVVVACSFPSGSVKGQEPVINHVVTGRLGQQRYFFGSKATNWVDLENWLQFLGSMNPPSPQPLPPAQPSASPPPRQRGKPGRSAPAAKASQRRRRDILVAQGAALVRD